VSLVDFGFQIAAFCGAGFESAAFTITSPGEAMNHSLDSSDGAQSRTRVSRAVKTIRLFPLYRFLA
jgi:hypothetical protein